MTKDISSTYVHIGEYKVDWADFDGEVVLRNFVIFLHTTPLYLINVIL